MPLRRGSTTPTKAYRGTRRLDAIYRGAHEVFRYIRPTYQVAQHYFNSDAEGWLFNDDIFNGSWRPAPWGGGAINARTNTPGIVSEVFLGSGWAGGGINWWVPGQRVAIRYTWSSGQEGSSNPDVIMRFSQPYSGTEDVALPGSNHGVQTYTTQSDYTTTENGYFYPNLQISLNDAWLAAGNYTRLYLHEALAIDLNTGGPLLRYADD
jgi:hypothetical protein